MTEATIETRAPYHRWVVAGFSALNGLLLFLFLMHLPIGLDELKLAIRGWAEAQPRISIVAGISVALAMVAVTATARLDETWRARLVYFNWWHAHPGHEAFFSLKEPPFDRKPLLTAYPEIRDAAYQLEVQYAVWRRLAAKHAAVPLIRGSQAGWLLLSELYLVGLLFLVGFVVCWGFNQPVNVALASSYLFLFAAQLLFLYFSARGTGKKLVNNVLAVELGLHHDPDAMSGKKAQRKKKF